MYLDKYETMDPIMLMSMVNMKLRDEFNGDLIELTKTYNLDCDRLTAKLKAADFEFIKEIGQFR